MKYTIDELRPLYGFVDPAAGKADAAIRRVRARSAIIVVGGCQLGRIFVLHAWAARVPTDVLIDTMYTLHDQYRFKVLGVEANAMQSLFVDSIIRDARKCGKEIPFSPVFQPTNREKDFRIRSRLQPLFGAGKLFIPEEFKELRTEIENFPMHPTKDLVDALASAVSLMPVKAPRRAQDDEAIALAKYLRETGAPGHAVQDALGRAGRW